MSLGFQTKRLSAEQAGAIYDVLVQMCGAYEGDRDSFVLHFCESPLEDMTSQWRFGGLLGFGGKFNWIHMSVSLYQDDLTPLRAGIQQRANARLAALRNEWAKEASEAAEAFDTKG